MNSNLLIVCFTILVNKVVGHGMMLDPPNRSSLWRFDSQAPVNYDDNANFCGGAYVQHYINGGLCGVCGDSYTDPHPQKNENTGLYGQGVVVAKYASGSVIDVQVLLTKNHLGSFSYSLCQLQDPNVPESGDDCFEPLLLEDGSSQYNVDADEKNITNRVQIPVVECSRCVFRWHYRAGNNWGECDDGTFGKGCGPQETFRSCSDIAIV